MRVSHTIGTLFSIKNHNKEKRPNQRKERQAVSHSLSSNNNNIKAVKWNSDPAKDKLLHFPVKKNKIKQKVLKTKIRNRFKGIAISVFVASLNTQKQKF